MSSTSTTYASSTSAAVATTSASTSLHTHDPHNVVVSAILGALALILLVGVVVITLHVQKRQSNSRDRSEGPFKGTVIRDRSHPAVKIVPFGTPGMDEHHYYRHTPGKDMRIAIRRPDGAWDFTDPGEPFTPSGVSDLQPSPMSSRTSFFFKSTRDPPRDASSAIREYKEQESRAAQMIRLGYDARDADLEMGEGPLPHPPPAYVQEPAPGLHATYKSYYSPGPA